MASMPAQQAAAGVLEDAAADEAQAAAYAQAQDAEVFGNPAPLVAEPLLPGDQATEATEAVEQPQDDVEAPEVVWDTPDELKELLESPDFDEEEEIEEFEGEGNVAPTFTDDEYDDPEKAALQKQLAKAKKQLAWAEEQKIKASQKQWREEARKYYQLADVDSIEAKSRRAFLKQADAQHKQAAKILKPFYDDLQAQKAKLKEEALAEARNEAAQRWGKPITGPQAQANFEDTQRLERERLDRGRNLTSVIKDKFSRGEVNL